MPRVKVIEAFRRLYWRTVWRVCAHCLRSWLLAEQATKDRRVLPHAIRTLVLIMAPVLALAGCGNQAAATAPSPPSDPTVQVTPIESSGPIRISFVGANISPGNTVSGCGGLIEGCAGRLQMTFQLDPSFDGPVLYMRVYLHATNMIACLWGEMPPFTVRGRVASMVRIPIANADRCGTPTTIATMAAVVEGPTQIESRQTWSLHYVFAP